MSDMTKIDQVVGEAAQKLVQVAEKYGPHAVDLTLTVGRVAAVQKIVSGLFLAATAYVLCRVAMKLMEKYRVDDDEDILFLGSMVLFVAAAIAGAAATILLLDLGAWVGMFRPDIYLAKKLLGL